MRDLNHLAPSTRSARGFQVTLRTLLATLALAGALPPDAKSDEGRATQILLGQGDSTSAGRECRPVSCTTWFVFETSSDAVDCLVGSSRPFRVVRSAGGAFTPQDVWSRLVGSLSPRSDSLYLVGAFVQFSGSDEPQVQVLPSGSGVACSMRRLQGKTELALAEVESTQRRPILKGVVLEPADLLYVRLTMERRTFMAVIRAPFLDPAKFDQESSEIRQALRSGMKELSSPSRWLYLAYQNQQPTGSVSNPK